MQTAGYSQTPLAKKLGIKEGYKIKVINQSGHYLELFSDMPEGIMINAAGKGKMNLIHFFTKDAAELIKALPKLKEEIVQDGIIWVSWPKKAAKVMTDVSENLVREVGLKNGLVDIKVCAVDEVWSGLKFVIPVVSHKL